MSGLLVRREVARQLPVAAASALIGLLVLLVLRSARRLVGGPDGLALEDHAGEYALGFVAMTTPLLLGATTVAPDRESGAGAFLRALPLRASIVLLLRFAVAAALTLSVDLPFAVVAGELPASLARGVLVAVAPIGAGLLAGLALGHTLPAFGAAALALFLPAGLLLDRLPGVGQAALSGLVALSGAACLLAALWWTERVAMPPRRLARLLGGPAAAAAGIFALWSMLPARTSLRFQRRNGALVLTRATSLGRSGIYLSAQTLWPASALRAWSEGATPAGAPVEGYPLALSPDERWVVACEEDGGASILDASTGEPVAAGRAWSVPGPTVQVLEDGLTPVNRWHVAWRGASPFFPTPAGLQGPYGELRLPLPEARLVDAGGRFVLLESRGELFAWDLASDATIDVGPRAASRLVGPELLALLDAGGLRLVHLPDLVVTLRASVPADPRRELEVLPSPDGAAAVLISRNVDKAPDRDEAAFEQQVWFVVGDAKTALPSDWCGALWGPDGQWLSVDRSSTGQAELIDVRRPTEPVRLDHGVRVLGFSSPTTVVVTSDELVWELDLRTRRYRSLHP